jgi:hypothetical protein
MQPTNLQWRMNRAVTSRHRPHKGSATAPRAGDIADGCGLSSGRGQPRQAPVSPLRRADPQRRAGRPVPRRSEPRRQPHRGLLAVRDGRGAEGRWPDPRRPPVARSVVRHDRRAARRLPALLRAPLRAGVGPSRGLGLPWLSETIRGLPEPVARCGTLRCWPSPAGPARRAGAEAGSIVRARN